MGLAWSSYQVKAEAITVAHSSFIASQNIAKMQKEIWKDVKGYEGLYQISNLGKIKRLSRLSYQRFGKLLLNEKVMSNVIDNNGYVVVSLTNNKKQRKFLVHRLIAIHFIKNNNNLPCINHIDGNKQNNDISNLEWCSYSQNNKHALDNNLRKPPAPWKGKFGTENKTSKKVGQYNLNGDLINIYPCVHEVYRKLRFPVTNIAAACRGKQKTAYGFKWKYINQEK